MRDFLDFLMSPEGFVEVRTIRAGKVDQWFTRSRGLAVERALEMSTEGWDAYYGVLPRLSEKGNGDSCATETTVLWADLDAKTIGSKSQALMSLVRYVLPPSVVVDSGHGYHAYWKLDEAVPFERARLAMIGIARELHGDHVYDRARILRIPGTTNYKADPVPVRTVVFNTTHVMAMRDFHQQVAHGVRDQMPQVAPRPATTPRYRSHDLPDWLQDLIDLGAPQGQRSEQAYKVMIKLASRGWSDAEIRQAFDTGGIGEKMREMRNGDRWFEHSLAKARTQVI